MKRFCKIFLALTLFTAPVHAGTNFSFTGDNLNPATIKTGLLYWFRATDGITKDGSNNVSAWVDKSSNAYTAAPTSSPHSPVWTANVTGSRPCLLFNGASGSTQSFLEFASGVSMFTDGSPRAYFGTIQSQTKGGTYYNVLLSNANSTSSKWFSITASSDASYGNFWFGSLTSGSNQIRDATGNVTSAVTNFRISYDGGTVSSAASWSAWLSNTSQTLDVGSGGISASTLTTNRIGEWITLNGTLSWKGYICELGAFNSAYSGTEGTKINTYQTGYWAN
jgi:hypothetical protein